MRLGKHDGIRESHESRYTHRTNQNAKVQEGGGAKAVQGEGWRARPVKGNRAWIGGPGLWSSGGPGQADVSEMRHGQRDNFQDHRTWNHWTWEHWCVGHSRHGTSLCGREHNTTPTPPKIISLGGSGMGGMMWEDFGGHDVKRLWHGGHDVECGGFDVKKS